MSNLSLRRLTDLLNVLVERCDAILQHDGSPLDDEALQKRVDDWFRQLGLCPLQTMDEAASLCEQSGLDGAAKKFREDEFELLRDWTNIIFHDIAANYSADEVAFLQQTYGPFPLQLADATRDEEVNRDRWASLFGKIGMLGEYTRSLLQSIDGATGVDLVTFQRIADLAGVEVKTVRNAVGKWRKADHTIDNPCSYATVQPLCVAKWPKRKHMFPADYEAMKAILNGLK